MATTLYNAGFGPVDVPSNPMLYDKTFDEIKVLQDKVPKECIKFVAERDTNSASYIEGLVTPELGLPHVSNDTEDIRLFQPLYGHQKTITLVQYRAGIIITKSAEREQHTRVLKQMMVGLPASADRRVEYAIADIFNNGFTSTTGGDGSYVFASDHTKSDASQSAWSNLMTASDFTTTNYSLMWENAQARTSERGMPDPHKITEVVFPPQIHQEVMTVLGSPKIAENALNGINPYQGDAKATVNHYLTDTDAFFGRLDYNENEGFLLVWSVRPDYAPISDSMNPELIWGKRLRMKFAVGVLHAMNWIGNRGV